MLTGRIYGVCAINDLIININNLAQAKGVTSRSIRLESINLKANWLINMNSI